MSSRRTYTMVGTVGSIRNEIQDTDFVGLDADITAGDLYIMVDDLMKYNVLRPQTVLYICNGTNTETKVIVKLDQSARRIYVDKAFAYSYKQLLTEDTAGFVFTYVIFTDEELTDFYDRYSTYTSETAKIKMAVATALRTIATTPNLLTIYINKNGGERSDVMNALLTRADDEREEGQREESANTTTDLVTYGFDRLDVGVDATDTNRSYGIDSTGKDLHKYTDEDT